jgi:CRP/FNR family cyclic AMP-dependent transcriptional regulator
MIKPENLLTVLHGHQWIHNFPWQHIETVGNLAEEVEFRPGDTIFHQGERSDVFYMITSGNVSLETVMCGKAAIVQTLCQGEEIGWSALMDEGVRHFTAKATTHVHALALSGPKLRETCERNPHFGYLLMKHLLFVVAERLDSTRLQLLEATQASE